MKKIDDTWLQISERSEKNFGTEFFFFPFLLEVSTDQIGTMNMIIVANNWDTETNLKEQLNQFFGYVSGNLAYFSHQLKGQLVL